MVVGAAWLVTGLTSFGQVSSTNLISGSIAVPGEQDTYTFSVTNANGARYYFDSLTNLGSIVCSLSGPTGSVVDHRAFNNSDAGAVSQPVLALVPGYYRVTVEGTGGATNGYAFRLIDLSAATLLVPGTVVSNTLAPGNRSDVYQFSAAAGDQFQFNQLTLSGGGNVYWQLIDPYNNVLFAQRFNSLGTIALRAGGTYTLLVEGYINNTTTVSYSLNVVSQGNVPPTPYTGTPLGIGQVATGNLTNQATNAYTFTLGATTRVVFDTLTNSPAAQWSLTGPPGVIVNSLALNSSDGWSGLSLLNLPAGDYQIVVAHASSGVVPYRFRLLDLSTATPITPGTPVVGTLNPSQETVLYRFDVTAGSSFFLDLYATNGPPNAHWRLVDPFNRVAAQAAISAYWGPVTLTIPGTYTMLVEGYYADDPGSAAYRIDLTPVVDGIQALSVGASTTGAISVPGQAQQYVFSIPSPASLYFDARTNNPNLIWSLTGPGGNLVSDRSFNSSDGSTGNGVLQLAPGDYTLTVAANGDTSGGYQFRLFDLDTASPATPGLPVTGQLNPANETQAYRFSSSAGAKVYFEALALAGAPNAYWRCLDPYGGIVFARYFGDQGPMVLPATGTYTLLVEGYILDTGTGTYSFNVVPVTDGVQELVLGDIVAGAINVPGQAQNYNFTLPSATTVYFDAQTNNPNLQWSLSGPPGVLVSGRSLTSSDASTGNGVMNLAAGNYTLVVTGSSHNTGGYQFRLLDLSTAGLLTPGTPVSGSLNPANATVAYQFAAAAGTKVYFNDISSSGVPNAYWRCLDPFGNLVFGRYFGDFGPTVLPADGIYTLLMEGYIGDPGSGLFTFNVVPVNDGSQTLSLGTVVAGTIASPGQTQIYNFTLAAGATLYFDAQTNNANLQWSLDGPAGRLIDSRPFTASDAVNVSNPLLPLPPGDYVLTVAGSAHNTGGFQFRLFDIASAANLTPGTVVGSTLNPANETVAYRFNAASGDSFFFHWISRTGIPNVYWRLYDPYGTKVFGQYAADAGTNVLVVPGTYTLFIEGYIADTGSGAYQFSVIPKGNVPPTQPTGIPLIVGTTVTGSLPNSATTNSYLFTLAAATRLYFDSLTNSAVTWSLDGPPGRLVNNRPLWGSDGSFGNSSLLCPAGQYLLTVTGGPGGFSFRLLDATNAVPFTPGTALTGSITPANGTALYKFNANAGDRFYFHGLPASGFSTPPYVKMLSPFGDLLLYLSATSDAATFSVPYSGTYLVSVEGQYNDTGTTGSFSFLLQPVSDGTNALTIGATVNGAISVAGQKQFYAFNLPQAAVLFFDTLTNVGFTWTLTGPPGTVVSARAFWSSDSADGNARLTLPAGNYTLTVAAGGAATGGFSFRLLDSSTALPLTPGTVLGGALSPGNSTRLYRFGASAGDRFYLQGQPTSGFNTVPYVKLYSPLGAVLISQPVNVDANTFSVPESGTYLVSVEGRYSDTSASGTFGFLLQPVADGTNRMSIGATVNGAISVPGQQQFYRFTLAAPALLFFDSLSNSGFTWSLNGPAGLVVGSRAFWTSDSTDGNPVLNLLTGDYSITVASSGHSTGSFAFRLLDAAGATSFTPGTAVTGSVTPGNGTVLYRFSASAGDRFYYEAMPVSGFSTPPYIRLISPLGNVLLSQQAAVNADTFSVPQSGACVLAVEGRYLDTSVTGYFGFALVPNPSVPPVSLFNTNAAPDLVVTGLSVTPSSGLKSGQSATVQWTTLNNGNAETVGSFSEQVTIRNTANNQIIVSHILLYDETLEGALAPGQTRPRLLEVTLPDGPSGAGTLEVTVTTDVYNQIPEQNSSGTGESNNSTVIDIATTLAQYPDLQVAALSVLPPNGWSTGQTVVVSWVITNLGSGPAAGLWQDSVVVLNTNTAQVILSITTNYDSSAVGNGPIAPGDSRLRQISFTAPNDINLYGVFQIIATTDSANDIFEYNAQGSAQTNNSLAIISATAPDLLISGLSAVGNPSLQAGAQLKIQWNTTNSGNAAVVQSFYDRIILRNTGTGEVLLETALPYDPDPAGNGPIAPGAATARQYVFQLPDGQRAVGQLQIVVTADTFNQVPEYNITGTGEANNTSQIQVSVAPRPYPDLVVTNVTGPGSGLPGQSVPVVWTILNQGTVPATGTWSDQIFLSFAPSTGVNQFLGTVQFTGALNAGGSLTRTQMVTLPSFGTGSAYFVVETDADGGVFDQNPTNNTAIAAQPTQIAATLTLALSPGTVREDAGAQASLATLSRNSDASAALDVTLASSAPGVTVPGSIQIAAGAAATTFYIGVLDDGLVGGDINAVLTAQATGHVGGTNTLIVLETDTPHLTLKLSAPSVAENAPSGSVTGQITRNTQLDQPLTVNLSSDNPVVLTVPGSVTLPIGATNATFNLTSVSNNLVTGNRLVTVYAAAQGFATVSAPITVLDVNSLSLTLQLDDSTISEGAINPATRGIITRSPGSAAALHVQLSVHGLDGGTPNLVQVPADIVIPANQTVVSFNVNVHHDNLAYGSQTPTILAQALGGDGTPLQVTASAPLTVLEIDGAALSAQTASAMIAEGGSTTLTITRNTPPTNALPVSLTSNPAGEASLPASVVIAPGQTSTNVIVTGINDGKPDGAQEVTLTASASGFQSATAPLAVTEVSLPDLAVVEVDTPTNALAEDVITVIWTVTNSGSAQASAPWVDAVYLATDNQGGSGTLMVRATNTSTVVTGDSYTVARSFPLPSNPGTYWVVVHADEDGNVVEGAKWNNTAISAPIVVQPPYHATVSTSISSAVTGTPIPLTGRTFFTSDGSVAPYRSATVRINVNHIRRTLSVISDAQGNFSGFFQPIPGEAGLYTVGADHPAVLQDPVQAQFVLLGMSAVPWQFNLRLAPNVPYATQIQLQNLSPLPLTGVAATAEGLPVGFNLTASVTNQLAGNETNAIDFQLVTTLTTPVQGSFNLLITSAEGAVLRIPADFVVAPPNPQLLAVPGSLARGMLRGSQSLVQFELINQGGAASGDLNVALPVMPWLSLVSVPLIPSIPPGGSNRVVLALNPAADLPLGLYDGALSIGNAQASVSVPFHFQAMSSALGDVLLNFTDELTYFGTGSPGVSNATVVISDPFTGDVVTNGTSDATGHVAWSGLAEGDYVLEASAADHSGVRGGLHVVPGVTTQHEVFMSQDAVTYQWSVVPTQIPDHYRVVIEPLFETRVPQPNLIVENPIVSPLVMPNQTSQFQIRLRNNGLIALQHVRIPAPSHPRLIITPLVPELAEIPAQSSISIPVSIRLAPEGGPAAQGKPGRKGAGTPTPCSGTECVIALPVDTRYRCGNNFVTKMGTVNLQVVCISNTGCIFQHVDPTQIDFQDLNFLADQAAIDCLMGHMDECQKARIRGFLASSDAGSVLFPTNAVPLPLSTNGFGLSAFCGCADPADIPMLFNFASNYLTSLGFGTGAVGGAPVSFQAAQIPGPCNVPPHIRERTDQTPGVCAQVRLQLSQDVTMTRAAFKGTLVLDNGSPTNITDIQLALDLRDANGQSASSLFFQRSPTLTGITAVDGSGQLAAGLSGSAEYIFIPTLDAAPTAPTVYYIGGTLSFTMNGQPLTIPLLPGPITVLPEAQLQLEYFQQRDVYADDPFTPEIEPSEPFALGLRVSNVGAGIAHSLDIQSAQPRIIDNEKGLLISFRLLGARIGNDPLTPSLDVNLGDFNPGQSKIVIWEMISSLQGKFIDYKASFEHLDDLGATNLSLIQSVRIHELIHVVRAHRPTDDTLPDFLVNDIPDPDNLPDTVYLSEGTNEPVSLATNPQIDAPASTNHLQVHLTATTPSGWIYLLMTNPGPDLQLVGAVRSDGTPLLLDDDVWTTDRTFPSSQTGAVRVKQLHLFDYNSTGSYTLNYVNTNLNANGPTSSVAALPATSGPNFTVSWAGNTSSNGSTIAFFDIAVSVNNGPFTNWLSQTTLRSAIYAGALGSTYSFYSIATDINGNRELPPATPEATTTTAASVNTAPTILPIADVTINENDTFSFTPTALDTDVPRQTLTFSLLSAPAGATINSATGLTQWQTGEAQGGTTNLFVIMVSDNGSPSLSATQSFNVIVRDVNSPPFFINPPTVLAIDQGGTLSYTIAAGDPDIPAQQLTWQLGPGAPSAMSIDPATGLLTWTPSTNQPGSYPVTVIVTDNGIPNLSASVTFLAVIREVNHPPVVATVPTQATLVGVTLFVTNSATDPDLPAETITFTLAPGAPRGAVINRTNGVFVWTPSSDYAHTTNSVTVRATDNGVPSLTGSQSFLIIVGDYLESRLGTALVLSGQTGSIPVTILSTTPATNVQFLLQAPPTPLTNFVLTALGPPFSSALLQPLGVNRFLVQLGSSGGLTLTGLQAVAQLSFSALPNFPSAFVPLTIGNVTGADVQGQPLPSTAGVPGRVVYLDAEPLLEVLPIIDQLWLYLYSRTGGIYTVQSSPTLNPPLPWTLLSSGPITNLTSTFQLQTNGQSEFFRAIRR